jgi:hypothetical protein
VYSSASQSLSVKKHCLFDAASTVSTIACTQTLFVLTHAHAHSTTVQGSHLTPCPIHCAIHCPICVVVQTLPPVEEGLARRALRKQGSDEISVALAPPDLDMRWEALKDVEFLVNGSR